MSLTPLQEAKLTHYFRLVDIDGDGYVTASDWAEIGRNLASLRSLKQYTPEYDGILSVMGSIWARLVANAAETHRASLAEWLYNEDVNAVNNSAEDYEMFVNTITRGVHRLLADEEGRLGFDEYVDLVVSFWVPPQEAIEGFQRMDADGKGYISEDDFVDRVFEFHRSDDPEAPGNWLFGDWRPEMLDRARRNAANNTEAVE
jgi:Ca2+-binding EF-hand superfamily protein